MITNKEEISNLSRREENIIAPISRLFLTFMYMCIAPQISLVTDDVLTALFATCCTVTPRARDRKRRYTSGGLSPPPPDEGSFPVIAFAREDSRGLVARMVACGEQDPKLRAARPLEPVREHGPSLYNDR